MQLSIVIFLFLLSFFSIQSIHAAEIKFLTHGVDGKTFLDSHGELRGKPNAGKRAFTVEVVRELMISVGHSKKMLNYPFVRAFQDLQNKENMALFTIARRPDREDSVKWVGPLLKDTIYLYEAKASPNKLLSLNEAKNDKRICVLRGGNHEKFLVKNGFKQIRLNQSYEQCFQMLVHGRVDFAVIASKGLKETLDVAKLDPALVSPALTLYAVENYLGFSIDIPDSEVSRWQKALDDLKASGRYKKLESEYLFSK